MTVKKTLLTTLSASLLFFSLQSAQAAECLSIASDGSSKLTVAFKPVVNKVFENAGYCIKEVNVPSKRAQKSMQDGELDGELLRAKAYIDKMSDHVVFVPTPIVSAGGFLVTSKKSGFEPSGVADVKDKKVGLVRGVAWHGAVAKHIKNTTETKSYKLLIKQLAAGRIDAFLIDTFTLGAMFKAGAMKKGDVHVSETVANLSGYIVLSKKNADMVEKLDASVKAVKKAG